MVLEDTLIMEIIIFWVGVCLNIFQKTLRLGIKKLRFGASSES